MIRLTNRQVNLLLELLIAAALLSGLVSWIVPLGSARFLTLIHAVVGLLIIVVAPLKIGGSVRMGFRRRRSTRWVSTAFGVLVLATVGLGFAHATGLWFGVGYWSALWTHLLLGFLVIPFVVWHVVTRPVRPSVTDLDRRGLVATGTAAAVAACALGAQELTVRVAGLAGQDRASTGSHNRGSFDPSSMPRVQWLDDTAPANTDPTTWNLRINGQTIAVDKLWPLTRTVTARLDCTGGWYADQNWDAVPLSDLLPVELDGRSVRIVSVTGYARLYPISALGEIFLALGYDGSPLRRGHGAPVRVVAPGRRGPQWIKWVSEVSVSDRPSWLQLPLPPT